MNQPRKPMYWRTEFTIPNSSINLHDIIWFELSCSLPLYLQRTSSWWARSGTQDPPAWCRSRTDCCPHSWTAGPAGPAYWGPPSTGTWPTGTPHLDQRWRDGVGEHATYTHAVHTRAHAHTPTPTPTPTHTLKSIETKIQHHHISYSSQCGHPQKQ